MEGRTALQHLQAFLEATRGRLPSVSAVLVSDADGAVLLKSVAPTYQDNSVDATLAALYAASAQQASKLQLGRARALATWHKDRVLVHVDAAPHYVRYRQL